MDVGQRQRQQLSHLPRQYDGKRRHKYAASVFHVHQDVLLRPEDTSPRLRHDQQQGRHLHRGPGRNHRPQRRFAADEDLGKRQHQCQLPLEGHHRVGQHRPEHRPDPHDHDNHRKVVGESREDSALSEQPLYVRLPRQVRQPQFGRQHGQKQLSVQGPARNRGVQFQQRQYRFRRRARGRPQICGVQRGRH